MLAEQESWRQYVPLTVSLLIILDIVLGSPLANSVLSLVRPKEEQQQQDDNNDTTTNKDNKINIMTKGERIDSSLIATQALERARNALEYQAQRDKYMTDEQRIDRLRKKMDDQLRDLDEKNIR